MNKSWFETEMLTENGAEGTNAHSKRIKKGIIQHGRDCKRQTTDFMKGPDKMSVKVKVGAIAQQNRHNKNPVVQQQAQKQKNEICEA